MSKITNKATKALGFIHVLIFLGFTIGGAYLIVDQPITRQTADALNLTNLMLSAYLTSFMISPILATIVTFFLGAMIPKARPDSSNWFSSNPISKAIAYLAVAIFALTLLIGVMNSIAKGGNQ